MIMQLGYNYLLQYNGFYIFARIMTYPGSWLVIVKLNSTARFKFLILIASRFNKRISNIQISNFPEKIMRVEKL